MKEKKVLSKSNIPFYPPWQSTAILWLLFDKAGISEFAWGIVWTFIGLVWLLWIVSLFTYKEIDIFAERNSR